MTDPIAPTAIRPNPRASCNHVVAHSTWRFARAQVLQASLAAPSTMALLGDAGTGKTWLLRDLERVLRGRGQPVTLLRQGDLPWRLAERSVLLIDEASRLSAAALAELAVQDSGLVVLADLPKFAERLERLRPPPLAITLPPLETAEVPEFVAAWLERSGRNADAFTDAAIDRLAHHAGGTPRLIVQLMNAALVLGQAAGPIGADEIDELAALRWDGGRAPPAEHVTQAPAVETAPVVEPAPVAQRFLYTVPTETETETAPRAPALPTFVERYQAAGPGRLRTSRSRRAAAAAMGVSALAAGVVLSLRENGPAQRDPVGSAAVPTAALTSPPAIVLAAAVAPPLASVPEPQAASKVEAANADSALPPLAWPVAEPAPIRATPPLAERTTLALATAPIPMPPATTRSGLTSLPAPAQFAAAPPTLLPPAALQPQEPSAPAPIVVADLAPGASQPAASQPAPRATVREPLPAPRPAQSTAILLFMGPSTPMQTATRAPVPSLAPAPAPVRAPAFRRAPSRFEAMDSGSTASARNEAPGLILVARRGDTLRKLYAHMYRGVQAPPFEEVRAANPTPLRRGTVVVFPAPANGWSRP